MRSSASACVAESLQAKAGLVLVKNCYEYQVQRIASGAPRFAPNSTVAGEHQFISFASILENQRPLDNYWVFLSPQVTDAEWDERIALNNYLLDWMRQTESGGSLTGSRPLTARSGILSPP